MRTYITIHVLQCKNVLKNVDEEKENIEKKKNKCVQSNDNSTIDFIHAIIIKI